MGKRLPSATPVVAGLLVAGLSIYAFLGVSSRELGPADYAPLAAFWTLVFLSGPGLWMPLEQEVARLVAERTALGQGVRPIIARAARTVVAAGIPLGALAAALAVPIADGVLEGERGMALAFALSIPGYGCLHLLRGTLTGQSRLQAAGALLAAEGLLRLAAGVAVAAAGGGVTDYAVAIGLAPIATVVLVLPLLGLRLDPGPPVEDRSLLVALGWLVAASALGTALLNIAPLLTKLGPGDDAERTTVLFAGLLLVRPPLYLWYGFTSVLIPQLTEAVTRGDHHSMVGAVRRIAMVVGVLTVLSAAIALLAGEILGDILYGANFDLRGPDLALLAVGTCAFMLANALGAGLIALQRQRRLALSWLFGVVALVALTLIDPGSTRLAEVGLAAGCLLTCLAMAGPLRLVRPRALAGSRP